MIGSGLGPGGRGKLELGHFRCRHKEYITTLASSATNSTVSWKGHIVGAEADRGILPCRDLYARAVGDKTIQMTKPEEP